MKQTNQIDSKSPQGSDVMIIAIGGPTCSGKTTLAKNLRKILPNSQILHQDDFAPKSEDIPVHPIHGVQDWDDPRGAIDWERLSTKIKALKENVNETLPISHDDLNTPADPIEIDSNRFDDWIERFQRLRRADRLPKRFIIIDGFLLYWNRECVGNYDLQFFVRESYQVLKERRRIRQTYHTADGLTWRDPPEYWDQIIWPAYLLAHRHMFQDGMVESGELDRDSWAGKDVILLEPHADAADASGEKTMSTFLEVTLKAIYDHLQDPTSS